MSDPYGREGIVPRAFEDVDDSAESLHGAIAKHYAQFFGVSGRPLIWPKGPPKILAMFRRFRVLEIPPTRRTNLWAYASVGAFSLRDDVPAIEFVLLMPEQNGRGVELVTMIASYHGMQCLGLGHTLPIGEPWLPGATADHLLLSKPYPLGPDFEIAPLGDGHHAHVCWLLPITKAERSFKQTHGLEALEQRLDAARIHYWDPARASVVE